RARREAGSQLLQEIAIGIADRGRVEGEVRLGIRQAAGLADSIRDVDVGLLRIVTRLLRGRGRSRCGRGLFGGRWRLGLGRLLGTSDSESSPNEERGGTNERCHRGRFLV